MSGSRRQKVEERMLLFLVVFFAIHLEEPEVDVLHFACFAFTAA